MSVRSGQGRRVSRRSVLVRGVATGATLWGTGLVAGCASSAPAVAPAAPTVQGASTAAPAAAAAPSPAAPAPKYGGTLRTTGFVSHQHYDLHDRGGMTSAPYT